MLKSSSIFDFKLKFNMKLLSIDPSYYFIKDSEITIINGINLNSECSVINIPF